MNIGSIVWPKDTTAACNRYLDFIMKVIDKIGIVFPDTRLDPRIVARRYIDGHIAEEVYRAEAVAWWDLLDAMEGGGGFSRKPSALLARLAISLLSVTPDEAPRLAEHLSWFFQIVGFMGVKPELPLAMMEKYFASGPGPAYE
jgi:hypothetical protein